MAHEILSVKLCQLDDSVGRLHSRIRISETANHARLQQEITALERECTEAEEALRENLQRSRSDLTAVLSRGYGRVEQEIASSKKQLREIAGRSENSEAVVEEELLLAEYMLDFAHRAADRALLCSMKAIDAQLIQEEGESL